MLSARELTLRPGPEPLFEQVNFTIFRGNKVGLTGAIEASEPKNTGGGSRMV
jgi:ATPase subunit of ABC transporter with duplicated ATPase domains